MRVVNLREAAARLNVNAVYLKGVAVALGVRFTPIGRSLCMSENDFKKVAARINSGKSKAATAS